MHFQLRPLLEAENQPKEEKPAEVEEKVADQGTDEDVIQPRAVAAPAQEEKPEDSEATQLTAAMNRGFIGTQILAKLEAYQMPPIGREIHINNAEQLYKVKLLDFNEKLAAMSAVEFDGISRGRVAKNTEETCFAIVKVLF